MTASNGNIFHIPSVIDGFTLTKASDAEISNFLVCTPEQTVEQTVEMPLIWDPMALIVTSRWWDFSVTWTDVICARRVSYNLIVSIFTYRQVSNAHLSRQLNCWSLRCSWSITCRRCSNYIFILYLTPGFNRLGKDKCKTRRESFKFWDMVRLILESLRYS